jgi:hypothetical protein
MVHALAQRTIEAKRSTPTVAQRLERSPSGSTRDKRWSAARLQSSIGNQAVLRFGRGAGNDVSLSRERMTSTAIPRAIETGNSLAPIQRLCDCDADGGPCGCSKNDRTAIQRLAADEDVRGHGPPSLVRGVLSRTGDPLPEPVRASMQQQFGLDFSNVRLHRDGEAHAAARALNARAFTSGSHVVVGANVNLDTQTGRSVLVHELAHVIQQSRGVGPRGWIDSGANDPLERAADRMTRADARQARLPSTPARGIQRQAQPPGAGLVPPGDCTWAQQIALQAEVDRACDRDTRCTQNDPCPVLWQKIGFNGECIRARAIINAMCFRGGNIGHIIALANAVAGLGRCWAVYNRQCQPQQGPVPAVEPAAEPERAPVVDRSFMERMAAITGLSGTALVLYLIVSEGSRLFPPRNLVPVP